ncbi:TIM-barrel domain-containing protein [Clostridium cellulovorans]|uniref:Glycoside hydrolase family 31 n=2 Tax=Clostridium cellulovorans TaxID=1493 RepID=D9STZ4_CLOC7|nr:TIM-barrel domain-containing protein [Clostridium cellulovorans]ADL50832.1 glycoside hydrolase family 31 [Clostridium cellulovorans 743B]BAV13080.1 alpha-glucosidase [Clostridium cellulovorans]
MNLVERKYQFVKVEDFFQGYKNWHRVLKASQAKVEEKDITVSVTSDIGTHTMIIQFVREDVFRLRFDPGKADYSSYNTRSVILDDFDKLRDGLPDYKLNVTEDSKGVQCTTVNSSSKSIMKITINYEPFSIDIYAFDEKGQFKVLSTASEGLYFTENGFPDEYSIIQAMDKSVTAKYIGFGEHGGIQLAKNTTQLTYFNYDNMKYSQMYNNGPLESKEPLYHSDPFFMEFYGVPDKKSVYGIFIDNPSEVCMDIGYMRSTGYMFGTRFGSMDYYFILGETATDIIDGFTEIVGKSRLKPRYALGYHQGCFGYDNREKVEAAVSAYRSKDIDIPLDGIHIDVDIQRNHKTFTIDAKDKFHNPKEMFSNLRAQGVKCSTNITPIINMENPEDAGDPENNPTYKSFYEGIEKNYFIVDNRSESEDFDAKNYHYYEFGNLTTSVADNNFNNGKPYIGGINYGGGIRFKGHYPDFGRKEVRYWWGKQYQYLFDMGLEMVWQDMTTPAIAPLQRDYNFNEEPKYGYGDMKSFPARLNITDDFVKAFENDDIETNSYSKTPFIKAWNLYSYNLHKATYHGLNHLNGRENKRNFIIGRGSFAGAHRFSALWNGDNASTWDFMRINISQCLALGLTGQAMSGQDIGGFEKGSDGEKWIDPELLIRWTSMGAFLPWFRNHYNGKAEIGKQFQEPYKFKDVSESDKGSYKYMYDAVLPICKYFIELRYRLMQLFYDRLFENTLNGMPICRAMFLASDDDSLFNDKIDFISNEFFVGNDLLVAPITSKGQGNRDVYLPIGNSWYQFMDSRKPLLDAIEGGTTLNIDASITDKNAWDPNHIPFTVPLYVRAGAIIPTIERERYVGELNSKGLPNPITLNIYPCNEGVKGTYTMYLDDGVSRSSAAKTINGDEVANEEYRQTDITHQYISNNVREIIIERKHDKYTPKYETYFFVAILHDDKKTLNKVTIGEETIAKISNGTLGERSSTLKTSATNSWYYNEENHISYIKVFDTDKLINITVEYMN